jgi:hypothetical protein
VNLNERFEPIAVTHRPVPRLSAPEHATPRVTQKDESNKA